MKIRDLEKRQKIILFFAVVIFIVIFILLFFFQPSNKYGSFINIKGYDKYIPNLPTDRKDSLNNTLYNITKANLKSDKLNINDANIRDGSVNYSYDEQTNINYGSFIVDIQSIKQSYLMSYEWSSDSLNNNLSGYTATASCLPSDKIIYNNFNCEDSSSFDNKKDPILDYLPHSTFNYTVTANIDDKNKTNLNVDIILYSSDTRNNERDSSINKYKAEVVDWIKSINLNPDDYTITYTVN